MVAQKAHFLHCFVMPRMLFQVGREISPGQSACRKLIIALNAFPLKYCSRDDFKQDICKVVIIVP